MKLSRRTRFEVLKRDGFRCRYCGVGPMSAPLEVDHVIPRSNGGTNDAENLVTACWDCNSGKSNVSLDEHRLPSQVPAELMHEHAEQLTEYLSAQRAVSDAKRNVTDWLSDEWLARTGDEISAALQKRLLGLAADYPTEWLLEAMDSVGAKDLYGTDGVMYFYGVLRRKREKERG